MRRRQTGLSMIELMVAMTIGLLLVAGVTTLISQQSGTRSELERSAQQIENGRYAMQLLKDDIEHAGYYGDFAPGSTAPAVVVTSTIPNACDPTDLGWHSASLRAPVPVHGLNASAATPTCVTSRLAGTDIIVVRRAETKVAGAAVAGETYLQASLCNSDTKRFVVGSTGFDLRKKDCSTPAELRKYLVRMYYISSCNVCGSDTIPTLKMVEFIGGEMVTTPMVEGIENLQFDYGIDNNDDGSPDTYTDAPLAADWENVMAVRINLLARSNETTAGYVNDKTYDLGLAGTVGPFRDGYKRHVFSQSVRVINPSGRREQ